ncbi:hypothetical protein V5N11_003211 [Cardamine amara subsp. amara]|uniref:Retrotransposon gag domain-containing protein n=1 Tax=Cardamine amara subsp. amara TaxID=228776 RepID=A0ABD0Z0E1_CARAN
MLEITNCKALGKSEMVNLIVLVRDDNGILHDSEGNLYNELGQKLDYEGEAIVEEVDEDVRVDRRNAKCIDRRNECDDENNAECADRRNATRIDRRRDNRRGPNGCDSENDVEERTLADYKTISEFIANRSATRPPAIQRNDFELNPAFYTLVGHNHFNGLPNEHPMGHIEEFEDCASIIKANGVSKDYILCKLFPHSLTGEAACWLNQLKPGSLTTWDDTKTAFLNKFSRNYDSSPFQATPKLRRVR